MISPIEVVKIQQQVQPERSLKFVAEEVLRCAGLRGFSRGFTSTLSRCGVYSSFISKNHPNKFFREPVAFCCYFSSFEALTQNNKENNLWLFIGNKSLAPPLLTSS